MDARRKLNVAYAQGSALLAGLAGALAQSWPVFALAWALLVIGGLYAGQIRPARKDPPAG